MTITVVDAFAAGPFVGNPAAVCLLDAPAPEAWMRALAREMNLSETAFLTPGADGAYGLRWLTPDVEVDLCGHATLASAHVLYESGQLAQDVPARFDTKSGRLTVRRSADATYVMDFPATPPTDASAPAVFSDAFAVQPQWVGRTVFDLFVVLDHAESVRQLAPDLGALARLDARGVIVTAPAGDAEDIDVVSRFFAPAAGVPEDPVTGSAHCAIGPYWARRLGRDRLSCHQASARGGHVDVHVQGDRVELTGTAVTIYHATLTPAATPPSGRG
ncbi:MAG: PhzF family phenazine biosynthesis protein [Bacteroidota bacterium]